MKKIDIEKNIIKSCDNDIPLFYIESGSRLWGMASPNSDYDVRGFHLENKEKYFDYKNHRDIKEIMDGEFDFVSYNIDKMFKLIESSNPTVLEWLRSDIAYYNVLSDFEKFKDDILDNINYLSLFGHYLSLAKNNFKIMVQENKFTYKKSLYCIRGILSARVSLKETIPELFIENLFNQCDKDYLIDIAMVCLEKKKVSEEKSQINQDMQTNMHNYIYKALKEMEDITFKTVYKKDKLSDILSEYSISIKSKYYK